MADMQAGTLSPRPAPWAQLHPQGWDRIDHLMTMKGGRLAGRLWVFLGRRANGRNAVVVSQELLARQLEVDVRSIRRATASLVEQGAVRVWKLGSGRVYVLNPEETVRCGERGQRFIAFSSTAVVDFDENPKLEREIAEYLGQPELELEVSAAERVS